jgi:hypothetical protein
MYGFSVELTVVAKITERLAESKEAAQNFDV